MTLNSPPFKTLQGTLQGLPRPCLGSCKVPCKVLQGLPWQGFARLPRYCKLPCKALQDLHETLGRPCKALQGLGEVLQGFPKARHGLARYLARSSYRVSQGTLQGLVGYLATPCQASPRLPQGFARLWQGFGKILQGFARYLARLCKVLRRILQGFGRLSECFARFW